MQDEKKEKIEKKYIEFQIIQQRILELQEKIKALDSQEKELIIAKDAIKQLQNIDGEKTALFPIVNGVFIKGKILKPENLIVNVGAGVAVKKKPEETQKLLDENLNEVKKYKDQLVQEFNQMNQMLQSILKDIENIEKE